MSRSANNNWLHGFAWLTAAATLALISIGGLVTSHGAGLAVPDWPNSYGYNMFLFPVSNWVGGILYEHSHRLVATLVGVLVVALTRWLGGRASRFPLAIIGLLELVSGEMLIWFLPEWKAAGYFLSGIAGVVLLAAIVWARNEPATRPLPALGWLAFVLVQVQGLLGGLRVVLFNDEIGIFHATLAQIFLVLLCAIVLLTSRWWQNIRTTTPPFAIPSPFLYRTLLFSTGLIFAQLVLGATMRHQHAGLAIPDFPMAYGKVWPDTSSAAVELYNQQRLEIAASNPITAFQILLQMIHRLMALLILASVGFSAWQASRALPARAPVRKMAYIWLGFLFLQVGLGAATIWSKKAADVATAHVIFGALSLATGALICIIAARSQNLSRDLAAMQTSPAGVLHAPFGARASAAGYKS